MMPSNGICINLVLFIFFFFFILKVIHDIILISAKSVNKNHTPNVTLRRQKKKQIQHYYDFFLVSEKGPVYTFEREVKIKWKFDSFFFISLFRYFIFRLFLIPQYLCREHFNCNNTILNSEISKSDSVSFLFYLNFFFLVVTDWLYARKHILVAY